MATCILYTTSIDPVIEFHLGEFHYVLYLNDNEVIFPKNILTIHY